MLDPSCLLGQRQVVPKVQELLSALPSSHFDHMDESLAQRLLLSDSQLKQLHGFIHSAVINSSIELCDKVFNANVGAEAVPRLQAQPLSIMIVGKVLDETSDALLGAPSSQR